MTLTALLVSGVAALAAAVAPHCPAGTMDCLVGRCLREQFVCDGRVDCFNATDEKQATCGGDCKPGAFFCIELVVKKDPWTGRTAMGRGQGRCFADYRKCDRHQDCADNSDEAGCPNPLLPQTTANRTVYTCERTGGGGGRGSLSVATKCDGRPDCKLSLDEAFCEACKEGGMLCKGRCISRAMVCDTFEDCEFGLDEQNCVYTAPTTTPSPPTSAAATELTHRPASIEPSLEPNPAEPTPEEVVTEEESGDPVAVVVGCVLLAVVLLVSGGGAALFWWSRRKLRYAAYEVAERDRENGRVSMGEILLSDQLGHDSRSAASTLTLA